MEGDDGVKTRDEQLVKINLNEGKSFVVVTTRDILTGIQILLPTDEPILLREYFISLLNHTRKDQNYFYQSFFQSNIF